MRIFRVETGSVRHVSFDGHQSQSCATFHIFTSSSNLNIRYRSQLESIVESGKRRDGSSPSSTSHMPFILAAKFAYKIDLSVVGRSGRHPEELDQQEGKKFPTQNDLVTSTPVKQLLETPCCNPNSSPSH